MFRTLLSTLGAAALAAALAMPALAQVQLSDEVASELQVLGIDATLIVTEEQLQEIENILNTEESNDAKVQQINDVLDG